MVATAALHRVYYPSCVANLTLRFDENLIAGNIPATTSPSSLVDAVSGADIPAPDDLSHVTNIVPRQASIELSGVRQAGTFSMSFAFRDLPLDPRIVRAVGVDLYLGTVVAGDFGTGMVEVSADGRRKSMLNTLVEDNLKLVGVVDTWSVEHTDAGSVVHIEGRDLRGLLLDAMIDPRLLGNLDLSQPIDSVVQQILEKHPAHSQFPKVSTQASDWPNGVISSPASKSKSCRALLGAAGTDTPKSQPPGDASKVSYWDIITRYCFLVGAVPYFRGRTLAIRPGRALHDPAKKGLFDPSESPFLPNGVAGTRTDEDGGEFSVRRLVYGRDITSLTFERKYTGVKVPTVEVVSVDTCSDVRGDGKMLVARWPADEGTDKKTKGARRTSVSPKGDSAHEEKLRIPVPGIHDQAALLQIAKDLYEEIGRGEMGGSCSTRKLGSFGGDNQDPDLARLQPGDAVELLVDRRALSSNAPLVSELVEHERRSAAEEVKAIVEQMSAKGFRVDEGLARAVVAASRSSRDAQLLNFFHVTNVKFDWSDKGLGVAFDFNNFMVPRYQVTPSTGAVTEPVKKTKPKGGSKAAKLRPAAVNTSGEQPANASPGGSARRAIADSAALNKLGNLTTEQYLEYIKTGRLPGD